MSKLFGVLWSGTSPIDGAPIAAIVTHGKGNKKLGDMVSVWVMRTDMAPHDAKRTGNDVSVCGHCPVKSACYVRVNMAPLWIYKRLDGKGLRTIHPSELRGRSVRWGAYGDPSLIPFDVVSEVNAVAKGWTGYTHQWKRAWGEKFKGVFMASVETLEQERSLAAEGWGTFRAGMRDGSDVGGSTLCQNERDGTTCADCGACNGERRSIYIPAHGAWSKHIPAERLAAKLKGARV